MNKEEKEQWLYEAYQYTSNFDFNRLDKYEEANDDICIDDLILDYTMLYEFHKEEIERLNKELETLKQPQVFIDTQDMEERYGEELYKEYLEKENKRLNNIIKELEKYIDEDDWTSVNGEIAVRLIKLKLQELKGEDKECR